MFFCLLGNRTHDWERMFWTNVQDHSFIQTLHAHSHTSLVSSGRWDDALLYMWMNKKVWDAGGPAVPDPWGQNARENPAGNIPYLFTFSLCVRWLLNTNVYTDLLTLCAEDKNTPHMLDDTDCDQAGVVCGLVLLEALCCSVSQSIHRADPQPVNCDP